MRTKNAIALLCASLTLTLIVSARGFQTSASPNPVLVFMGPEFYSAGGKDWTRYTFSVENFAAYPDALFAASPGLPPCGNNTNASRTWIDFYDARGKRLNGFCALGKASNLNGIWFAIERDIIPPSYIYIEMTDRQTKAKYKSNLADTVQ
jgi:hypothetical protein